MERSGDQTEVWDFGGNDSSDASTRFGNILHTETPET